MAKPTEPYVEVWVESYEPVNRSGMHGLIHIRPTAESGYSPAMHVRCSKSFSRDYPVGTHFLLKVKLTDKEGGGEFLHSHHSWKPVRIVKPVVSP